MLLWLYSQIQTKKKKLQIQGIGWTISFRRKKVLSKVRIFRFDEANFFD